MGYIKSVLTNIESIDFMARYGYAIVKGEYRKGIDLKYLEENDLNYDGYSGKRLNNGEIISNPFNYSLKEMINIAKELGLKYATIYNERFGTDDFGISFSKTKPKTYNVPVPSFHGFSGFIRSSEDAELSLELENNKFIII